jgi:predicted PurR-regulated permease PerM
MWQWFVRGTGAAFGFVLVAAITAAMLRSVGVLLLVAVSILLATGLEPAIGAIRSRTRLGRGPTILIVYAGFFLLFAGLLLLIVPSAARQLGELSKRLPTLLDNLQTWAKTLGPPIREAVVELIQTAKSALNAPAVSPEPTDIVAAGVVAADAFISAIGVLSLIFFWLTGHQRIQRFALALLPAGSRHGMREAWNEVETRLGLWVRGQLILMGTIFGMTSVAYFVLGLEGALFLGLVAGIAEAIPIVGPALGAVPALIVAAASGRVELVALVAVVYVVIQVVEGNVLVPLVMRSTIGVPPFIVLISLLVGAAIDGVVGAFLAVPFTAALIVILERGQARHTRVPLEAVSTAETPTEDERQAQERVSPDSRGSLTS